MADNEREIHISDEQVLARLASGDQFYSNTCYECGHKGALFVVRTMYVGVCPKCVQQRIDDLGVLIEKLDVKEITLLAHDWGGAIGMGAGAAAREAGPVDLHRCTRSDGGEVGLGGHVGNDHVRVFRDHCADGGDSRLAPRQVEEKAA